MAVCVCVFFFRSLNFCTSWPLIINTLEMYIRWWTDFDTAKAAHQNYTRAHTNALLSLTRMWFSHNRASVTHVRGGRNASFCWTRMCWKKLPHPNKTKKHHALLNERREQSHTIKIIVPACEPNDVWFGVARTFLVRLSKYASCCGMMWRVLKRSNIERDWASIRVVWHLANKWRCGLVYAFPPCEGFNGIRLWQMINQMQVMRETLDRKWWIAENRRFLWAYGL